MIKNIIASILLILFNTTIYAQGIKASVGSFNFYTYILDSIQNYQIKSGKKTIIRSSLNNNALKNLLTHQSPKNRGEFYRNLKSEFDIDSKSIKKIESKNSKLDTRFFPYEKYLLTDTCTNETLLISNSGYCPSISFSDILYVPNKNIALVIFEVTGDYSAIFIFKKKKFQWSYYGVFCESFY